jgi:hypothetical protein
MPHASRKTEVARAQKVGGNAKILERKTACKFHTIWKNRYTRKALAEML